MKQSSTVKKLLRIALFTSTAIGLITVGPAYVVGITLGNITTSPGMLLKLAGVSIAGITVFIFIFWLINIGLLNFTMTGIPGPRRKNLRYFLSYLVCLLLMFFIRISTMSVFNDSEKQLRVFEWKLKTFGLDPASINTIPYTSKVFQVLIIISVVISINTVVLIIQDLVLLNEKKRRTESENTLLRIRNIEAANQKLKQQLQPHFLFNSLNVLKTLIRKQPDKAEVYLKRLSDFLRASVSSGDVNTVTLTEELRLSTEYFEMQKIRFEDAIHLEVSIPEEIREGHLPVFSIQLLFENAIKHNVFTSESPLTIKLLYEEGWLTVSNNLQRKMSEESSSGLGLANLSERYRIISGDEIMIRPDASNFSVSIKILKDEDRHH